jgi:hypothetical protein
VWHVSTLRLALGPVKRRVATSEFLIDSAKMTSSKWRDLFVMKSKFAVPSAKAHCSRARLFCGALKRSSPRINSGAATWAENPKLNRAGGEPRPLQRLAAFAALKTKCPALKRLLHPRLFPER